MAERSAAHRRDMNWHRTLEVLLLSAALVVLIGAGPTLTIPFRVPAIVLQVLVERSGRAYAAEAHTVRDEFNAASYGGSDGTAIWRTDWRELGQPNGPCGGPVGVVDSSRCASGYCLLIGGYNTALEGCGVSRGIDLSGASSATLSLSYQRWVAGGRGGTVILSVSGDGGKHWSDLCTYELNANDRVPIPQSLDITPYLAPNTQIRFRGSGTGCNGFFYVDNVQVEYSG